MLNAVVAVIKGMNENRKLKKAQSEKALSLGPSWRHRRRLIYGAYFVAILMIFWGAVNVIESSEVGVQLVIGGVALLSIILTSYTAMATYEDVKIWKGPAKDLEDPEDQFDTDNPDGI